MQTVPVESIEQAATEGLVETLSRQVIDPHPGESAKRDLESARPVDPTLKRVLLEPAFELARNLDQEILPSRQQVGLGQQDQVLMAVEFPNNLVVARLGGVEIGNAAKVFGAGFDAAGIVPPPADLGVRPEGHAQQREAMRQYFVRDAEALRGEGGCLEPAGNIRRTRQAGAGRSGLGYGRSGKMRRGSVLA